MSSGQQIGDMKGRQLHIWQTDLWGRILQANPIPPATSAHDIQVAEGLPQELLAGVIASQVYEGSRLEVGNSTLKILVDVTRLAATKVESTVGDRLVGYFGDPKFWMPQVLSVGYLARVFDCGITAADLLALGVDDQIVTQLTWWQRREGEGLLEQQVRAELAGWTLPAIALGYRETWGNLFRFLNAAEDAEGFREMHREALTEIEAVLDFFGGVAKHRGEQPVEPSALSDEEVSAWAQAFEPDLLVLLPDIYGQFAYIPKRFVEQGKLAEPLTTLARYLRHIGVTPEQFQSDATILARFARNIGRPAS